MMTIIAEVGQNFMGDISLARQLILLARNNGADLAKFQLYDHNLLYTNHPEIPNVELSQEQAFELFNYGKKVGIEVFFSVFDVERVKWCEEMGVKRYKVACRMRDKKTLDAIGLTKKPVIISTSFGDEDVLYHSQISWRLVTYLYCIPEYPCQISPADMKLIMRQGSFSDHTIGLDAAKIALARGARIIEKHFCINHQTGIDAEWSMTPAELQELKRWELVCQTVLSP